MKVVYPENYYLFEISSIIVPIAFCVLVTFLIMVSLNVLAFVWRTLVPLMWFYWAIT